MSGLLVSGDTNRLDRLADAISILGRVTFRTELLEALSQATLQLVQEEFVFSSADPYGNPWKPLKKRRRGLGGPLLKTGRMMRGIRRRVTAGSFSLVAPPPAQFHQHGTRHMPARQIFPTGELPPKWAAKLERIADEAVQRAMEGLRL